MEKIKRLQTMRRRLVERAMTRDTPRKHHWLAWINKTIARIYTREARINGCAD